MTRTAQAEPDLAPSEHLLTWATGPLAAMLESALFHVPEPGTGGSKGSAGGGNRDLLGARPGPSDWKDSAAVAGNPDGLLHSLVERALALTGARCAALLLLDPRTRAIAGHVEAGTWPGPPGCDALLPGAVLPCPVPMDGRCVTLCGARSTWPAACRGAPDRGPMAYCLPLLDADGVIGLLQLAFDRPLPFPASGGQRLALAAAAGAALVIKLARDQRDYWYQAHPHALVSDVAPVPSAPPAATAPSSPCLEVRCFGNFELRRDGAVVAPEAFHWRRARTLLKILVTQRGRQVARDTLIELLWPGVDPDLGANRLYVVVHALRKVIEPQGAHAPVFVRSGADHYVLRTDAPLRVDVDEFLARIQGGQRAQAEGNLTAAAACFAAAVDLYRGDFLEDEPFAEWCWLEREHLREVCLDVLRRAASLAAQMGEAARSVAYYRRALQMDPLREESLQGLLRVLAADGRPAEALREYQRFHDTVQRELGIPPLPETQAIAQQVRTLAAA